MSFANKGSTGKGILASSQNGVSPDNAGDTVSARARVMVEFQKASLDIACRFMQTQQRVMLAYLAGGADSIDCVATMAAMPVPQSSTEPRSADIAQPVTIKQNEERLQPRFTETAPAPASIPTADKVHIQPAPQLTRTIEPVQKISNEPKQPDKSLVSSEHLISSLIEIISERTGYPPEMLDPALDLEADLGIDSIKRVEVLNSFRKLLSADQQQALEDGIEELAGMKTLQSLTDWIRNDLVPRISALPVDGPPGFASQTAIGATGDLSVR